MRTLIKSGRIVTAVDDYHADIFIDGETVTTIGKTLDMEADVVIDVSSDFSGMQERIVGRKTFTDCGIEQFVVGC